MENTLIADNIIASVFKPYINIAKIQWRNASTENITTFLLTGLHIDDMIKGHRFPYDLQPQLILKSLSDISDEDAIEVVKIIIQGQKFKEVRVEDNGIGYKEKLQYSYLDRFIKFNNLIKLNVSAYQLLQSKGYDLPNYLLGGKTLQESGLAIYE